MTEPTKCPKCGADATPSDINDTRWFLCGTSMDMRTGLPETADGEPIWGEDCLRRQLAAANERADVLGRAANYWWIRFHNATGTPIPTPTSSDPMNDAEIQAMAAEIAERERRAERAESELSTVRAENARLVRIADADVAGSVAFLDGTPIDANPYGHADDAHDVWAAAWMQTRDERAVRAERDRLARNISNAKDEYADALRNGLDANGAWECAVEALDEDAGKDGVL